MYFLPDLNCKPTLEKLYQLIVPAPVSCQHSPECTRQTPAFPRINLCEFSILAGSCIFSYHLDKPEAEEGLEKLHLSSCPWLCPSRAADCTPGLSPEHHAAATGTHCDACWMQALNNGWQLNSLGEKEQTSCGKDDASKKTFCSALSCKLT